MSRIAVPSIENVPVASQSILEAVRQNLGVVPNLFRLIAHSPVALTAFSNFQGTMSKSLDVKTRERIAIAVAQVNGCDYCLSAHAYLGLNVAGLSAEEIAYNRDGGSSDARAHAAVHLAASVARQRGAVSDADIAAVRLAGYSDAQIVEIVALVAENTFTNYLNQVAQTEIDFPVLRAAEPAKEDGPHGEELPDAALHGHAVYRG